MIPNVGKPGSQRNLICTSQIEAKRGMEISNKIGMAICRGSQSGRIHSVLRTPDQRILASPTKSQLIWAGIDLHSEIDSSAILAISGAYAIR